MGAFPNPLRPLRRALGPMMEPPPPYTPPFAGGQHPLDQRETMAVVAPERGVSAWSGMGFPPPGMEPPERPAPDPFEPPPPGPAEAELERLRRSAPEPEKAGFLRQLGAGLVAPLYPFAGTDIPGKIAYRNYDELTGHQRRLAQAEDLAEAERARREEGLERGKAGTARMQAESYARQVAQQEQPETPRPSLHEQSGTQFIWDPQTKSYRASTVPGFQRQPDPPKLIHPGTYQGVVDESGRITAQPIEGLPERGVSDPAPTMSRMAMEIAELEAKPLRTPAEEQRLRQLRRAVELSRAPARQPLPRIRQLSDGRWAQEVTQEDGSVVLVPVEGENPVRPTRARRAEDRVLRALGIDPATVPSAGVSAPPTPTPPGQALMTESEFIADFTSEEGRPPTPEEKERLRGVVWK